MRRFLLSLGGLFLLVGGAEVASLSTACNEPVGTTYGNPNALDRKRIPGEGGAEPLICGGGDGDGGTGKTFDGGCPSFAADIFPYFQANGKWRCADSTCHGGASAPPIAGDTPAACLESLRAIAVAGQPYVVDGGEDPNASTLLCNLQGTCGSPMPKPPGETPTTDELCIVSAWLGCGAPP